MTGTEMAEYQRIKCRGTDDPVCLLKHPCRKTVIIAQATNHGDLQLQSGTWPGTGRRPHKPSPFS